MELGCGFYIGFCCRVAGCRQAQFFHMTKEAGVKAWLAPAQARPRAGLPWVWAWGLCKLPPRAYTVRIAIIPASSTRRAM